MKEPWRRVLFEKQNYPDNYIDPGQFLENLFAEPEQKKLSLPALVLQSTVFILHYVLVVLFLSVYKGAYSRYEHNADMPTMQLHWLINITSAFLLISIVVYAALQSRDPGHDMLGALLCMLKKCGIIGIYLRLAAPVLSVLTSSFSDDTIYALVILFSAVHLVFFDYCYETKSDFVTGSDSFGPPMMKTDNTTATATAATATATAEQTGNTGTPHATYAINNISLNAAMLTTILLASRLRNLSIVLLLVVFAIILFCVLPHVIRLIYLFSPVLHLLCTVAVIAFTGSLLLERQHDAVLFNIFMMVLLFMWLICPLLLVYLSHSHKRNNRRIHTGDVC